MSLSKPNLPLDLTGSLPGNRIKNIALNLRAGKAVIFAHGVFFGATVELRDKVSGEKLKQGRDYELASLQTIVSTDAGNPAYGLLYIKDSVTYLDLLADVSFVGGEYERNCQAYADVIAALQSDQRQADWMGVLNIPTLPAAAHASSHGNGVGYEYITHLLADIQDYVLEKDRLSDEEFIRLIENTEKEELKMLDNHTKNTTNPHADLYDKLDMYDWRHMAIALANAWRSVNAIKTDVTEEVSRITSAYGLMDVMRGNDGAARGKIDDAEATLEAIDVRAETTAASQAALEQSIGPMRARYDALVAEDQRLEGVYQSLVHLFDDYKDKADALSARLVAHRDLDSSTTQYVVDGSKPHTDEAWAHFVKADKLMRDAAVHVSKTEAALRNVRNCISGLNYVNDAFSTHWTKYHSDQMSYKNTTEGRFIALETALANAVANSGNARLSVRSGGTSIRGHTPGKVYLFCVFGYMLDRRNTSNNLKAFAIYDGGIAIAYRDAITIDWPDGTPAVGYFAVGTARTRGDITASFDGSSTSSTIANMISVGFD